MHGADSDVLWLQRDFGVYVVNLFDTGQAARVLALPNCGLAHVLEACVGFKPDKRFQLADWRIRPLTDDMLQYARCDTHFLLAAADRLRRQLDAQAGGVDEVWRRSCAVALSTYQKPLYHEEAYLDDYRRRARAIDRMFEPISNSSVEQRPRLRATHRCGKALSVQQLAVYAALFAWRDRTGRRLDEGVKRAGPTLATLRTELALTHAAAPRAASCCRARP